MRDRISQRREALRLFVLLPALTLALLLAGLWLAMPAQAQEGTILRVKSNGTTGNGCGDSWANACQLQTALSTAHSGAEIWVASGVYTPGTTVTATFNLTAGVALYGGFPDTGNPGWDDRDWITNATVLSGDIGDDDVKDANGVVTSTSGIVDSNAYHVVTADGSTGTPITETTVLDGFTITAGQAEYAGGPNFTKGLGGGFYCGGNGSGSDCSPSLTNVSFAGNWASYGGAMYNSGRDAGSSSPNLTDVTFAGNRANWGGAIYNDGISGGSSSPSLTNVSFSDNSATDEGGAMYSDDGFTGFGGSSSPSLTNVSFTGNSARSGGAMCNRDDGSGISSPSLTDVIFSDNTAFGSGGALLLRWSAISSPTLTNVSFYDNSAGDYGGAMYNASSGLRLIDVTFASNSARWGGAMYNGNSSPSLTNVIFAGNSASGSGGGSGNGGAMWNQGSSPSLTNVFFYGNTASDNGGAMFNTTDYVDQSPTLVNVSFAGNHASGSGGAMYNAGGFTGFGGSSSPSLTNVSFAGNSANYGGAITNDSDCYGCSYGNSSVTLANTILWGNTAVISGSQIYNSGIDSSAVISYSLIQDGCPADASCDGNLLTDDPLFVDADGPDNTPGTADDDLRLQPDSPAIDTGNDAAVPAGITTDLAGLARIVGVSVDMGAYERQATAHFTASPTSGPPPLTVTFTDLSIGDPDQWWWGFGDGITSTAQHPVYTYTLPGIYTVTLAISSPFGANTVVEPNLINVLPPTYLPIIMKTP